MPTHSHNDHDPALATLTLDELQQRCEAELAAFRRARDCCQDSQSCEEILRRAAQRDEAAFERLWQLSIPLVRKFCPAQCRDNLDDLQQEVGINLLRKFRHPTSPFQTRSFAAYRKYLHTTVYNTCQKLRQPPPTIALETVRYEPSQSEPNTVMRYAFYERCLVLLPDELHREAFQRRFVLREDIETIAAALRDRNSTVTTAMVYRLIERCIKLLAKQPEIRDMLESDGGNDL